MNKYSLTFSDQQLEEKFQDSNKQKSLIQCKILALLIIIQLFLVSINILLNEYYLVSGFTTTLLVLYIGFYVVLTKYPQHLKYGILWFQIFSILAPIFLQFYIWLLDIQFYQKIGLIVGFTTLIPQLIISQNIFINSGLYIYAMIMITVGCLKLLGFSMFLLVPILFSINWISSKYQSIKLERTFFSESQTNECLATVLRRICKEKIMIFTYDDMNIRYQEYLLNDECKKYFNHDPINQILSNIFVTFENERVSISSYIHRNVISNHNEEEFYSEELQGYFKEKNKRFFIELYVHTTSKTFFTIKITEKEKDNTFSKAKAQKLLEMQNKLLHKILPKFIEIFHTNLSQNMKIQQFYQFLNQKIQILQLFVVCNSAHVELVTKQCDLVHQISEQFNKAKRRFIFQFNMDREMNHEQIELDKQQVIFLDSDEFLLNLLLKNILMLIQVTIAQDNVVTIQIIGDGDQYTVFFSYQPSNKLNISDKTYSNLKKSTIKLIKIIGIQKCLIIKESFIQLTLVNILGPSFSN